MLNERGAARIEGLVSRLLDRDYDRTARAVLTAINANIDEGAVGNSARALAAEARRLADAGQALTMDNPYMRAYFADLRAVGADNARLVADAGTALRESGATVGGNLTREFAIGGLNDQQLASIGVRWNTPDPEAVARAVGYLETDTWRAELGKYAGRVADRVQDAALRGIIAGWNPTRTARELRDLSQSLTLSQANTLMRTLQLTSYRDAAAIHQRANADILSHQIRIGTLDGRICLACIALHGTRLEVGERVDDHHNGRCVGVPVVRGRERAVITGEAWFSSKPLAEQRQIAGDGAFELLQSGRADLRDFAVAYEDPTFGRMIGQATNQSLAGGQ